MLVVSRMIEPKIARWAACITALGITTLPLECFRFPLNAIAFAGGIGIALRRSWNAYGLGLYFFSLCLSALLLPKLQDYRAALPVPLSSIVVWAILAAFFVAVGRIYQMAGEPKGWCWPWICLSGLTVASTWMMTGLHPT
jgi:hypothetical protein